MKFNKSMSLLEKTSELIPVSSQVFSKSPRYFPIGASPLFIERGKGSHVWDVDDNEFIDYMCALGPITLGYHYPATDRAIKEQLSKGITFSQPSPLEYELARAVHDVIPCADMVRFLKTGSEACQAAVRVARAFTGRDHVAFRGYHGWHEWYAVQSDRPKGIPKTYSQYIHQFTYNDIDSLEEIFTHYPSDIACVIMEPMIYEAPVTGFLEEVQGLCEKYGALLIFDETVTGFRWSLGGAQEYFGVTPDLATFGKGMGNGMPIGAVCGRSDVMKEFEEVFVSSTFGGECLSLAASISTIIEMENNDTIGVCWKKGAKLLKGLEKLGIGYVGYPCRPILKPPIDNTIEANSLLMQEMIKRGVLVNNIFMMNICYSLTNADIDKTIIAFADSLEAIKAGAKLKGKVVSPAFKRL